MTPQEWLDQVILPAAQKLGIANRAHLELGFGTCAQESGFRDVHQHGGPALGPFQMEPRTHEDLWERYLHRHPAAWAAMLDLAKQGDYPLPDLMMTNLQYAAGMMFVKYLDCPGAIPADLDGQAAYYKRWYNSPRGAATEAEYKANFEKFSKDINWSNDDGRPASTPGNSPTGTPGSEVPPG